MQKDVLIAFYKQIVPLSPEDEVRIRERFVGLEVAHKRYLLRAGEVSHQLFFVVKGCVRVVIVNKDGEDISCYFAAEGQFVADYHSFITGKPASYSLQCLEDSQLLLIDRKGLDELYALTTHGERFGRLIAEKLFIEIQERLTSFYSETPEQRYLEFLKMYPHLVQRLPQHHIAAYIGVRPPSLSRIKRRALEIANR
jgi:CRP-like cAMP-binding protein